MAFKFNPTTGNLDLVGTGGGGASRSLAKSSSAGQTMGIGITNINMATPVFDPDNLITSTSPFQVTAPSNGYMRFDVQLVFDAGVNTWTAGDGYEILATIGANQNHIGGSQTVTTNSQQNWVRAVGWFAVTASDVVQLQWAGGTAWSLLSNSDYNWVTVEFEPA